MTFSITLSGSAAALPDVIPFNAINTYAQAYRLREYLTLGSDDVADDKLLKRFLYASSRAFDRYTKRRFYPYRRTRAYDLPEKRDLLRVDDDLLESFGLSHLNGTAVVARSVYHLRNGDDWNSTPYNEIELERSSGSLLNFSATRQKSVRLDGLWGYREEYDENEGWVDSRGTLTNTVTSAQTLLSVSASQGYNSKGFAPRFLEGQTWRLGNELVSVLEFETPNTARVLRGINGTTATSHASGVTLQTWQPEPDVEEATLRLSAFTYEKSKSPYTGRVAIPNMNIIEIPESWPADVKVILDRYRKYAINKVY
jgi:hypothetical protein